MSFNLISQLIHIELFCLQIYSNFHDTENTFIDVDVKELNDILRTNKHTEANEDDDSNKNNIKYYNRDDDDEIEEEEEDNFNKFVQHECVMKLTII